MEFQSDAAIDRIQVSFIRPFDQAAQGLLSDFGDFVVDNTSAWPVSFEIDFPEQAESLLMRIRGFNTSLATKQTTRPASRIRGRDDVAEVIWYDAPQSVVIDRLVTLPRPLSSRADVEITLSLACMGRRPNLGVDPPQTCIDAQTLLAPATAGVQALPTTSEPVRQRPPQSQIGKSSWIGVAACSRSPQPGSRCIPGGLFIMGSPTLTKLDDSDFIDHSCPFPVSVSPFFLDETEFTIGRLRALLAAGAPLPAPVPKGDSRVLFSQYCTWDASASDDLPVNCYPWAAAREACKLAGGDLPTEAQWEFAARGRGKGWRYPWGPEQDAPTCCSTNLSRLDAHNMLDVLCAGDGIVPVGKFAKGPCEAKTDVTPEGIVDLSGNVAEYMLDTLIPYSKSSTECSPEKEGILVNRLIGPGEINGSANHAVRGQPWGSGLNLAASGYRFYSVEPSPLQGFRCAYLDR